MFVVLSTVAPILAFHEPAAVTSTYEVLEPKTWIGKELPILEYIDIAAQIKTGNWLLLFYHHDCPDCQKAIPQYEQMARDLAGNEDFLRIALIEVPPYGQSQTASAGVCTLGRLDTFKKWILMTPATCFIRDDRVNAAWEGEFPTFAIDMMADEMSQNPALRREDSL